MLDLRRRWTELSTLIDADLRRENYAVPVDLFRICAGLLLSVYFVTLYRQSDDFTNPDGLLDHELIQHIFWFTRASLFQPGLGLDLLRSLYLFGAVAAWGIVVGYRVRLWATLLFLIAVSAYRWNFIVMYVDDSIAHLLLFWLIVLPSGRTLNLGDLLRDGPRRAWSRWLRTTVPGAAIWCVKANFCLLWLVAGLWKLESPFWHQGFALYATLRLPIAFSPDAWEPADLPLLRVATYAALLVEPVLPVLLTLRPGHWLKWMAVPLLIGFHAGIMGTLRIPFANVACVASGILFFDREIMAWLLRRSVDHPRLRIAPALDRAGKVAFAVFVLLSIAMMRRTPLIGWVHAPAYAVLWGAGIAQDYQLFNWIDRKNVYATHKVWEMLPGGRGRPVDPTILFPNSLRGSLLQAYLHDVRWIKVPPEDRDSLKRSILERSAARACRLGHFDGIVAAWSYVQLITPDNVELKHPEERFLVEFQCKGEQAVVCRTLLDRERSPACSIPGAPEVEPKPQT